MAKQIVTGENSRQAILRGVNILADAVKITLGRRGATRSSRRSLARRSSPKTV